MAQSLVKTILHLTFSTKLRRPLIVPEIRTKLNAYLGGILRDLESPAIEMNCAADHAHVLFCLSKNHPLVKVVEELKRASSKWIKSQLPSLVDFYWQAGYASFSVSQSNVAAVRKYIVGQDEHHRKMTFQEELLALLKRHEVEYDERYLWA